MVNRYIIRKIGIGKDVQIRVVLESRVNKLAFYEKIGYIVKTGQVIHGDTFDSMLMEKELKV